MKIAIVATSDRGGAGKAALRLHLGLLEIGADSHLVLLKQSDRTTPNAHEFLNDVGTGLINKTKLAARYYANKAGLAGRRFAPEIFTYVDTYFDLWKHPTIQSADVINLHWTAHFLDWRSFFGRLDRPLVWTLHDQSVFTGGCHYSFDCDKYTTECVACPQLRGSLLAESSRRQQLAKEAIIQGFEQLTIVTPSRWLCGLSQASRITRGKRHEVIPYSIEHDRFVPHDTTAARRSLGLPTDKKVLLFVADDFSRRFKGAHLLVKALNRLERNDYVLCSIGKGKLPGEVKNHFPLGYIRDEGAVSEVYSAADIFITPSLQDNFPNTVLESQMCGTPVMGFPICGIREMLKHGQNGILCDAANEDALASSITSFLDGEFEFSRDAIRKDAMDAFHFTKSAQRYLNLFHSLRADSPTTDSDASPPSEPMTGESARTIEIQ